MMSSSSDNETIESSYTKRIHLSRRRSNSEFNEKTYNRYCLYDDKIKDEPLQDMNNIYVDKIEIQTQNRHTSS